MTRTERARHARFFQTTPRPHFTEASLARCYALLQGAHPRCGSRSVLSMLPPELLRQICLACRAPIDNDDAYHFSARGTDAVVGALDLWLIVQQRHDRHDRSPTPTRIVLQHVELPDLPSQAGASGGAAPAAQAPLVTRMLGHYEGFNSRHMLIRWTHRIEAAGIELCEWPAACTAAQLRAPPISPAPRSRPWKDTSEAATASPCALVLPRLAHARQVPSTTLELERLSFKRVLLARPDVHHTSLVLSGRPSAQMLHEAADSMGDAEECFHKITTGARSEEEAQQADDDEAQILRAMAAIEAQCARIRVEAELEQSTATAVT